MFGGLAARVVGGNLRGIGVDLRLPLKPIMPALDQLIALPCASVMVIIVLLKLALMCATPLEMFFLSRRLRGRVRVP